MPRECLPPHLQDELHTDWIWPFSYVPRAWNAYCGKGPIWETGPEYQSKPIPDRGFKSAHTWDSAAFGEHRSYWAITYSNGLHIRHGYRWDNVDNYYNYVVFTAKVVK